MSAKLLDYVANKIAVTRVDTAWIKGNCKSEFDGGYWAEILKCIEKADSRAPGVSLQVGANTNRYAGIRELLAGGTTQILKPWKGGGGVTPGSVAIDGRWRNFVDVIYMLEGRRPSWELIRPFPVQWEGSDRDYEYFAAKFAGDHLAKNLSGATSACSTRTAWFLAQGVNLPDRLHFVIRDGLLANFHDYIKRIQGRYGRALDELHRRQIVNKGHVINRIWMTSPVVNVAEFSNVNGSYVAPAVAAPMSLIFQLHPYEKKHYVYHMSGAFRGAYEVSWPWVRKDLEFSDGTRRGRDNITLYVEYMRP